MAYGTGTNAPWGLKPICYLNGALWNDQVGQYLIASGYTYNTPGAVVTATGLFTGDPVTLNANGTITIATAGSNCIGSFQGCRYIDSSGNAVFSKYWPSGATATSEFGAYAVAFVADDPNILFDVQVSNALAFAEPNTNPVFLTQADLYANYNFSLVSGQNSNPQTGNTQSGLSGYYLDRNTQATTATLNLKAIRFTPIPGNDPTTVGVSTSTPLYNNVLCLINNHVYKGGTGTAGVV